MNAIFGKASRIVRACAAAAVAFAAISAVSAPLSAPLHAQEARLLAIHDDATRDMVRQFLEAARARGTPTEPLVSRALEGVAFKASPRKIEQAMESLEKRIHVSREILGENASVDELTASADALANHVPESAIRDLRRSARQRPITVEIGVLTELVAKGVAPREAAKMVRDLMAHGATGAQLTELNAAVQQDVALGISPLTALTLRGRGVMSLLPPAASVNAAQRP